MLSDVERKLLRITLNRYRNDWHTPDIQLLSQYSQRDNGTVRAGMRRLHEQGYLEADGGKIRAVR
ncbi:hypothetical protein [Paenibacillus eucommiae]|uniref:Transcriptional regulator n=1 Tax=Paenibacillus eucommiae TaxID=1355755 RepID=A0ABS4IYD0_9BACL|nr:hypothetical protein [Paenibacillus eucommiae]MBP1992565.1 putative transcriptional regulator [Paenibacillus eucommiae]